MKAARERVRRRVVRVVGLAGWLWGATGAQATDLNLRVESGGQPAVTVSPGATVSYAVVGELSDAASQGLALFSFDLTFSGGGLAPAATPVTAPLTSFAVPAGLNNPQGFGGVPTGGVLRQVGGAQNTINNSFGAFPVGSVTTGVGLAGAPVVLASGQLTAPVTPGSYTLTASGVVANVIRTGATGTPVWDVEPAAPGNLLALTVTVQSTATKATFGRQPGKGKR